MGPGASELFSQYQQSHTDVETEAEETQLLACSPTASMWQTRICTLVWLTPEPAEDTEQMIQGRPSLGLVLTWFEARVPHMGCEGFPGHWRYAIARQSLCVYLLKRAFIPYIRSLEKTRKQVKNTGQLGGWFAETKVASSPHAPVRP